MALITWTHLLSLHLVNRGLQTIPICNNKQNRFFGPSEKKHFLPETWNTHGKKWLFPSGWWFLKSFYMGKWVVKSPTLHPLTTGRLALEFQVLKHLVLSMEEIRLTTWHVWNPVNHGIFPTNLNWWIAGFLHHQQYDTLLQFDAPPNGPNWPRSELATKTLPTPGGGDVVIKMTWVPENSGFYPPNHPFVP